MKLKVVFIFGLAACRPDPLAGLTVVPGDHADHPLPGLDADQRAAFAAGDARFSALFTEAEGLGPVYARPACSSCHADDMRGPGEVQRMSQVGPDGVTPVPHDALLPFGTMARPLVAGGARTPLLPPSEGDGLLVSFRAPPPVVARGWIEAVDAAAVSALAARQAADHPDVAGQIPQVAWQSADVGASWHGLGPDSPLQLGRFGLKSRISTLDEFTADALQGDMSITTPYRPTEPPNPDGLTDDLRPGVDLDADAVRDVATYMRLLDIPPRTLPDGDGEALFADVGCALCHVPSLPTDRRSPAPQLRDAEAALYTDLLLHDLGPDHADGLTDQGAGSTTWRTSPLVGLRFQRTYLHDGRALSVEDAILLHGTPGSQAHAAVDAFDQLPDDDRAALLAFVAAL